MLIPKVIAFGTSLGTYPILNNHITKKNRERVFKMFP